MNSTTSNNIKIAYLIPRFHPFKGGAERNVEALAERMAKDGSDVTVITTDVKFRNEKSPKEEMYKGIKIVRVHAWNKSLYAGFYPGLLPYLLTHHFDVIHTSGIGFVWREFCLIGRKIFRKNTNYITTPHGPFMVLEDSTGFRGFARKWYTRFLKIFLNWLYDAMIQVTPTQSIWMVKDYGINPSKIHLVPNGIDVNFIEKSIVEHANDEKVVISFTGRMEWYKGAQDVIRALAKLKDARSNPLTNFEFVIMGRAGNYSPQLKSLVEELRMENFVRFVYSPSDEERDNILYNESQIHILPSKWEGTGIVLIEAMAKGNVIVTTTGNEGATMLINHGDDGFIYNFTDIDSLAKILRNLIENYDLRTQMRFKCLAKAKDFTWDAVFPSYVNIIKKLQTK